MTSGTYIAFLRGINVGGKNRLPMKDLTAIFSAEKCGQVRTYIQSGNVIFTANRAVVKTLAQRVSAKIEEQNGYRVPVVLRTAQELAAIVQDNPFIAQRAAEEMLHVLFLTHWPEPSAIERLDPDRSAPDAFILREREIFLHLPNGAARTKLTNGYFDTALKTISTGRNWRTIKKIHEQSLHA